MIHYHGTPVGGTRIESARFLRGRHALIAWGREEDLPVAMEVCQSFCIDNGAFSAWKTGTPITDWGGYFQWVLGAYRHPAFDFAIVPDAIDGSEDDNNDLLARWYKNVPPLVPCAPVWHLHESFERLEWLAKTHRSMRLALGSSGDYKTPGTLRWWNRIGEAMRIICDDEGRPMCRLHGLRMLDVHIFCRLPLASADSTNAVRNGNLVPRFGMYPPPTLAARQGIIADRIESHQSAGVWVAGDSQTVLSLC